MPINLKTWIKKDKFLENYNLAKLTSEEEKVRKLLALLKHQSFKKSSHRENNRPWMVLQLNSDIVSSNRLLQFYKSACKEQKKEHSTAHFLKCIHLIPEPAKNKTRKKQSPANLINIDAKTLSYEIGAKWSQQRIEQVRTEAIQC